MVFKGRTVIVLITFSIIASSLFTIIFFCSECSDNQVGRLYE
jgi:hypothetical protein